MFDVRALHRWFAAACLGMTFFADVAQAADGARDVHEIAEKVRDNEHLYRNINLVFRENYELVHDTRVGTDALKRIEARVRCVLQEGLFYFKIDGTAESVGGARTAADTEEAFDGEYTRVYERQSHGNLHHGPVEDARLPRPHTLIFRIGQMVRPLSQQLLAGEYHERFNVRTTYAGEEEIDDLNCVKLRTDFWPKEQAEPPPEKADTEWLWLAIDRNYLPIKRVAYATNYSADLPVQTGSADDLREISPGIWFAFHVTVTAYDAIELTRGNTVASNVDEYIFSNVELDPGYPRSCFSLRFPKGTSVDEIENGKIVRHWIEGERGELISAGPVNRRWLMGFNIVVVILAAAAVVRRLRRPYR